MRREQLPDACRLIHLAGGASLGPRIGKRAHLAAGEIRGDFLRNALAPQAFEGGVPPILDGVVGGETVAVPFVPGGRRPVVVHAIGDGGAEAVARAPSGLEAGQEVDRPIGNVAARSIGGKLTHRRRETRDR